MALNTVNLVGDGDDVDIVVDVEGRFGVKIGDREAADVRTVGDLYDLVRTKLGEAPSRACLSQTAFYRLRGALKDMGCSQNITPHTPVSALHELDGSIARVWRTLGRRSGLTLPELETPFPWICYGREAAVVSLFAIAFFVGKITGLSFGWVLVSTFALGAMTSMAILLLLRDVPRRLATIGDLAEEAAGHSFAELHRARGSCSPRDVWLAVIAIVRHVSGHKAPISRATTFFAEHAK